MNQQIIRILCVDDEPLNLSLLEAMLVPRGYEVVTAGNGPEALQKIRTLRIDICLLDVMMPNMDGFEVCRRIKDDEKRSSIPVIMITALSDMQNRIKGIEAGAEDFISKPFETAEVLARITMLLHVKTLNDRLHAAYQTIARLSSFGEHLINEFDPVSFDFLEKIDSIVQQIIRKRFDLSGSPEIVIIGMLDPAGICRWLQFDSTGRALARSSISMDLDPTATFSNSRNPVVTLYNEDDSESTASVLVKELQRHNITVSAMVHYANESFCLIALNYGRKVTTLDAAVLSSVVMQSLFLRSLAAQIRDTESAFEYTVYALARASEANDEDTGDHILRVGNYCALLARQLHWSEKQVQVIRVQAALHDVGKIQVSPAILKKPGKLTDDEWREMQMHTIHGSIIIGGHHRMSTAARIALSHHERYDGSGYPHGISGEQIPIEARILNLADQYDALRNTRCYKPPFDHETTFRIITDGDGRTLPHHFDPQVLAAFKEIQGSFAEVFEAKG